MKVSHGFTVSIKQWLPWDHESHSISEGKKWDHELTQLLQLLTQLGNVSINMNNSLTCPTVLAYLFRTFSSLFAFWEAWSLYYEIFLNEPL